VRDTTQSLVFCQRSCHAGYQDFLFDRDASLNYYSL
jgi:hypothetical protein